MKILCFGAHPDDIEFGVGGLIIKEIEKGNQVKNIVCSLGEAGSSGTPEGRKQESIDAASISGAEIEFFDLGGDCHIEYTPKNSILLAKEIRKYQPDIILTPQTDENQHPDHAAIGKLARDASRLARYGGLQELKDLPVHRVSNLYYYFITQPFTQSPDLIIDVSAQHSKWEQSMQAHKSQISGMKYLDMIGKRAAGLGSAIGVDYAIGIWSNDPIHVNSLSDLNLSSRNY